MGEEGGGAKKIKIRPGICKRRFLSRARPCLEAQPPRSSPSPCATCTTSPSLRRGEPDHGRWKGSFSSTAAFSFLWSTYSLVLDDVGHFALGRPHHTDQIRLRIPSRWKRGRWCCPFALSWRLFAPQGGGGVVFLVYHTGRGGGGGACAMEYLQSTVYFMSVASLKIPALLTCGAG